MNERAIRTALLLRTLREPERGFVLMDPPPFSATETKLASIPFDSLAYSPACVRMLSLVAFFLNGNRG